MERDRQEIAMLLKRDVAVPMAVLLIPGLLYAMPAASQGDRDSKRSSNTSEPSKPLQAPVGHRQPTAADVPKDVTKDAAAEEHEKRERELDAKLQICRGC
jgi:hypothetical protein